MTSGVSRRRLIAAGLISAAPAAAGATEFRGEYPWTGGAAAPAGVGGGEAYVFFTSAEAAFVKATAARLIPKDDLGPGAVEAGVPEFIDRQLAGEFGHATRWYMQGPWSAGETTQGYQSRYTPADLYRAAIAAIDHACRREFKGETFAGLAAADQDAFLTRLEKGAVELGGIDGKAFFEMFLQNVLEGFWSDPIYGGNRDMVGWKLIGFPGARYDYAPYVSRHGERLALPPVGLEGRPSWRPR
ncbi:MAG: gluconate 2-dehydrogenase subunit 3 family protein [Caulobacteraceae bacterium]|nr:gluconate 2-dehydrogenase subunit 3 family protein [Caulobacteraceae bacterium]